jgi:hypothetical protein
VFRAPKHMRTQKVNKKNKERCPNAEDRLVHPLKDAALSARLLLPSEYKNGGEEDDSVKKTSASLWYSEGKIVERHMRRKKFYPSIPESPKET